ncbi:MAG: hypothetical protein IPK77_15695 [Cellvibrio sp.]|nr:hypothetical protein [Cellvibrio sp.]
MIFQSTEGLAVTGAIDKNTLQRINLLLGIDSILTALPENISNQSSSISVEVK